MFAYLNRLLDGINKSVKLKFQFSSPDNISYLNNINYSTLDELIYKYLLCWSKDHYTLTYIDTAKGREKIITILKNKIAFLIYDKCKVLNKSFTYSDIQVFKCIVNGNILSPHIRINIYDRTNKIIYSTTFIINFYLESNAITISKTTQS